MSDNKMLSFVPLRVHVFLQLIILLLEFDAGKAFHRRFAEVAKFPIAKIIKGKDVRRNHLSHPHPYLVSIQFKNVHNEYTHTCGGAIIDKWTVLTAAHCFDDDNQPDCWGRDPLCYRIVAGMYSLSETSLEHQQAVMFSSNAIEMHENFDGFHYDNDIALIDLEVPLNYSSYVKSIRLVNPKRLYNKTNATIAGWGTSLGDEEEHYGVTDFLQEAHVDIYTDEQCKYQWGDDYHPENMICAAGAGDFHRVLDKVADACQGDSGGPLVAKDVIRNKRQYLVGVISWGYECGIREYPGLYTRVETYLPWIKEKRHKMKLKRQRITGCTSTD